MKETILSISEKSFILAALSENRRLDGRAFDEYRPLKINFGSDWGCCMVTLGETKVIAQASCEVQQPKPTRPNEGLLLLYVELSPMGAPQFEVGRQSDLAVQLNRLLEKCIKDSRCVDLESLCITAEEKVWAVRVDINVLNHEGNLVDAASVAALTALSHFRRPDVTTTGEQTIIHDPAERDPIPITLHHHPVCVSYAVFDKGNYVVIDPTSIEERVSEGNIVFGVNAYRELCGLHLGGRAPITSNMAMMYASGAAKRALVAVTIMKKALAEDLENRKSGIEIGFQECIEGRGYLSLAKESKFRIQLFSDEASGKDKDTKEVKTSDESMHVSCNASQEMVVVPTGKGTAELSNQHGSIKLGKKHKLQSDEDSEDEPEESSSEDDSDKKASNSVVEIKEEEQENMSDSEIQVVAEYTGNESRPSTKVIADIELSGDSEEEETFTLHSEEVRKGSSFFKPSVKLNKNVKNFGRSSKSQKKKENDDKKEQSQTRGWYTKPSW